MFEDITRKFQHKVLKREDQDEVEGATEILLKTHHKISMNQAIM